MLQPSAVLCYRNSLFLTVEEKIMNPKTTSVEAQKRSAQAKLDARRVFLREKGLSDEAIRKEVTIRKLKAEVRKSDSRLAAIASQEEVSRRVAQAKAEKLAAATAPKKAPEEAPVKKEKKEKKAKKERSEKQAESEGKKEKPEKKAEQSQAE